METGFKKLDDVINSFNCGELVCIASRPGIGKTTLSIDIVNNVSSQTDNKILFISLESSKEYLEERIKSNNVDIIANKLSISDIVDTCRKSYCVHHHISLIVIDYLQLIENSVDKNEIVERLKLLALELNTTIILTSQLSKYNGNKPILLDIAKNSNSLINNCDKIITLYIDNGIIKLEIIKNSTGPVGEIGFLFNEEKLCFEDVDTILMSLLDKNCLYKWKSSAFILLLLKHEELLLPFDNNYIVVLVSEEDKTYIPLFTDEKQIKDIKYTRLDKVKLDVVIRDIYKSGRYYAISINPFTDDFILNSKLIEMFNASNKI